jgi:hypothetical protein
MNERIKELIQAADRQCSETRGVYDEILAELVIRECMSINRQRLFSDYEGDSNKSSHNNALWCACADMQEHFGI